MTDAPEPQEVEWRYRGKRARNGKTVHTWLDHDGEVRLFLKPLGRSLVVGAHYAVRISQGEVTGLSVHGEPRWIGPSLNPEQARQWSLDERVDTAMLAEIRLAPTVGERIGSMTLDELHTEYRRMPYANRPAFLALAIEHLTR